MMPLFCHPYSYPSFIMLFLTSKKKEKEIGEKIGEKLERKEGIDKEEEEEELINEK